MASQDQHNPRISVTESQSQSVTRRVSVHVKRDTSGDERRPLLAPGDCRPPCAAPGHRRAYPVAQHTSAWSR
ncbi:unnamed protein product [Pieris brassicae]|uniref:Uncharacterized protein n=1 Tax=Pieris brassicae TaxID=7116 RepID=A0A9P0TPC2_PIEBR|nr:unnamed protein product [Pieris brassicae]